MNEKKIKELFELCLRVSNETTAHVNFDYTACDDISRVYIYVFNDAGEIVKHFSVCQFYEFPSEAGSLRVRRNTFWNCLSTGGVRYELHWQRRYKDEYLEIITHRHSGPIKDKQATID